MVRGTWYWARGSRNFCSASLAQPAPIKFGTKAFIVMYFPNPSSVPNLKLLSSAVAEIYRGSQHDLYAPVAHTPAILALKVSGKLLTTTKLCSKYKVASFNGCRNKYVSQLFMLLP